MALHRSDFSAFDAGAAPFLYFENQDVAHWGGTISLGGAVFTAGDTVEFRDATHSVREVPEVVSSTLLRVAVPANMGPGYIRIWRGDLRSNIVPVNFYP